MAPAKSLLKKCQVTSPTYFICNLAKEELTVKDAGYCDDDFAPLVKCDVPGPLSHGHLLARCHRLLHHLSYGMVAHRFHRFLCNVYLQLEVTVSLKCKGFLCCVYVSMSIKS